jgi:hypothetical protein
VPISLLACYGLLVFEHINIKSPVYYGAFFVSEQMEVHIDIIKLIPIKEKYRKFEKMNYS